ncbi:MAG: phosphoserine phosphatase SerB [Bacteroides sp.]|nr:phosphoserine phosphatase SerB [Bacteroides sp.]
MNNNTELILIRITGLDRPGLTASITEILSKYDVTILDIGQADIHSTLSLGILFKSQEKDSGNIMKELLFKASALGINIRFYPVTVEEYEEWVNMQGKNRYILTLLGRKLTAKQIAAVTGILAEQGLNIDAIKRLTGRIPLDERKANVRACIEFSVRGTPRQREEMQQALMKLSSDLEMDFSFQLDNMYRRMRRLICFDMDSTLIQTECIDELAERAGVGDQVREITERAMRLDESVMKEIAENLPITEGVERLMFVLKRYGYKIAILSGGFTYFGNYLKDKFGIDYVYANELEIVNGKLTGRYLGDVVDGKRKAELLKLIAQVERVDIAQTIAVGDGANDLPMLSEAGLGIAFHAKPKVVANAQQSINTIGLDGVLYFLGFKDSYLEERGKL